MVRRDILFKFRAMLQEVRRYFHLGHCLVREDWIGDWRTPLETAEFCCRERCPRRGPNAHILPFHFAGRDALVA